MRIGIDGYNFAIPHGTGIATYGFTLARTLRDMGHQVEGIFGLDVGENPETREVMFFDALNQDTSRQRSKKELRAESSRIFRRALNPFTSRTLLEVPLSEKVEKSAFAERMPRFDRLLSFPALFEVAHRHFNLYRRFLPIRMENPPEIMHWTYPVPVRLIGSRNIYTLHDIVPLKLPYTTLDVKPNYFKLIEECIEKSDKICTVSETSANDIRDQFGDPARKIFNTYQTSALSYAMPNQSAADDADMIEGIFGLKHQKYFLFYGSIEPKKNIGRLIEAYLSIRSEAPLVVVGSRSWRADEELRLLPKEQAGMGSAGKIIRLDYMPRALLVRLIRGARAVAFPSLYEGFGLPLLEGMQLGVPVLASRASSLPEIGGDAAIYADPYDAGSIAAALKRLDTDANLRTELGKRGIIRAEAFSPERYRERLGSLYAG